MTKIDTKPEADKRNALQLAGALEDYMMAEPAIDPYTLTLAAAATELRRLHAENAAQAQQIAQDRADAARWRYSIADGGNQTMNWRDVYDDWDGDGYFADVIDRAMAEDARAAASGAAQGDDHGM